MRVLSANENHFQNLLGIKELTPSKLKLGYVALAFHKSLPSQRTQGSAGMHSCWGFSVLAYGFQKRQQNTVICKLFLINSLYHSAQSSLASWALPQGKILKTSVCYSKIKKPRPGQNRKQRDIKRKRSRSFTFLLQHKLFTRYLIHFQCDFGEIQL